MPREIRGNLPMADAQFQMLGREVAQVVEHLAQFLGVVTQHHDVVHVARPMLPLEVVLQVLVDGIAVDVGEQLRGQATDGNADAFLG